jgi:alpha-mannosidase
MNPLLITWATNNYWETNFRGSQPGMIQLRYAFNAQGEYIAAKIAQEAQQVINSPIVYQVVTCPDETSGQLINMKTQGVKVLHVKASEDKNGIVVRVINFDQADVLSEIELPGKKVAAAWRCSTQEENINSLKVTDSKVQILLKPREITSIRIE